MSEEEKNVGEASRSDEPGEEASPKNAIPEALRILEALIFASDELLTAARLRAILPGNPGGREITSMVAKINRQLAKERHPFEIVEIGGGYQFKTVAYYHPWVRQIFQEKAAKRLSIQALECLSIIAYRQPLSKAEIEAIRGVISDGAMKTLLERRLVTITGRSEKPGRPLLYGTTPEFLKYFGLNKIDDLPNIEEFEAMIRQKIENLPVAELQAVQELAKSEATEETPKAPEAAPQPEAEPVEAAPEVEQAAPQRVDAAFFAAAEEPEVEEADTTGTQDGIESPAPAASPVPDAASPIMTHIEASPDLDEDEGATEEVALFEGATSGAVDEDESGSVEEEVEGADEDGKPGE